jgi:hypothetical protein
MALLGTTDPELAALLGLDPEKIRQQQQQAGLLSAGLAMLAASGPSQTRTSLGQIIGQGGLAGMQAYGQAGQQAVEQGVQKLKVAELKQAMQEKQDQRRALAEYSGRMTPGQALAIGGGPTPAAAQILQQGNAPITGGARSTELLRRMAADARLPASERQLALKELEITAPKPLQLDQAATLYAITQGYDIQNLTRQQASDILSKTKELTPDQLIQLGRFQRETGLNIPGLTLGGRVTTGEKPAAQPAGQPTVEPSAAPKFNPTVQSAAGLTLQQRQELASKLEEAKPKVISSASSMLNMLDDKRNTALQLLNNKSALDAISGTLGKIAVESGISTTARDANLLLQNVKSRNFVLGIQEMRNNSPTGGAVGNVAIPEMESISNIEAAMVPGQSRKQLEAQLQQVVKASDRAKQLLLQSIRRDYGDIEIPTSPSVVSTRPPGAKPIPTSAIDYLRANPNLKKEFDDYYGVGSADSVLGR